MKTCAACIEFKCAVCRDCFEHRALSRELDRACEEQKALTQAEIEEEQLEFTL